MARRRADPSEGDSDEERLAAAAEALLGSLPRYRADLAVAFGTHAIGIIAKVSLLLEAYLLCAAHLVAGERGEDLDASLKRLFGGGASANRATAGQLAGFLATMERGGAPRLIERIVSDLRGEGSAIAEVVRLRNGLLHASRIEALGLAATSFDGESRDRFIAAMTVVEGLVRSSRADGDES